MPRIIKSAGSPGASVTDYDRDRAPSFDEMLSAADIDPRSVLAEARMEAERKVREAYEEGLRRGQAAGLQRFAEAVGEAADALPRATEEMLRMRRSFLDALEPQLIRLSVALAERILQREITTDPGVVATTARAALEKVLDEERVVLRVNPKDLEVLRSHKAEYLDRFAQIKHVEILGDSSIPSGGCIATTPRVEIDARISEQLATLMTQMLAESAGVPPEQI